MPRLIVYNLQYNRKFEIVLSNDITKAIQEEGIDIVPDLLKQYYKEKMKFKDETSRLSRRETFENFIDYTFSSGEYNMKLAPTADEMRSIQTAELSGLIVPEKYKEQPFYSPEQIGEFMEDIASVEPVYIVHELPRPSRPNEPFRLLLTEEGRRYWIDIDGNKASYPDINLLPVHPFVPKEYLRPIEPFPPTSQHIVRIIQLRNFKIDVLQSMKEDIRNINEMKSINRRISSYRGWNTRYMRMIKK